jgi:hypothetical protein
MAKRKDAVISVAAQVDACVAAYQKADWDAKFAHGWTLPGCPGGGAPRKSRPECTAATHAAVVAETALTEALMRITGTTREKGLAHMRSIAVATARWLVMATPMLLDVDCLGWSATISPRVHDIVCLDGAKAMARQINARVAAYQEADLAAESAAAEWGESRRGLGVLRERGELADRLVSAKAALVQALLRAVGTTPAQHLLDPHPIAVATSLWVVTAVPSVVLDRGQPSDTMAWELFVAPRARDIVFVGGD